MRLGLTLAAVIAILAALVGAAAAQDFLHFEGYLVNSTQPPLSPNPHVSGLAGTGLISTIFPPLQSNFVANEYTWELSGLSPTGTTQSGSVYSTTYDVSHSSFKIFEDPTQDARPTFYGCPADLGLFPDWRYHNGSLYLSAQLFAIQTRYDTSNGLGEFSGRIRWDGGAQLGAILPCSSTLDFFGTTSSAFACIPFDSGYDQTMAGRASRFCDLLTCCPAPTPVRSTTWGALRRVYR